MNEYVYITFTITAIISREQNNELISIKQLYQIHPLYLSCKIRHGLGLLYT
jgi:hypothetical protein